MITESPSAVGHGIRRGVSNVIGATFASRGYSNHAAKAIARFCDYGSYFLLSYYRYSNLAMNDTADSTSVFWQALTDTGSYFLFKEAIRCVSNYLDCFSSNLSSKGWRYTSTACRTLSQIGLFSLPVIHANPTDRTSVVTHLVIGNAAQIATESTGEMLITAGQI